jgi:hypothetical protein
MKKAVLIAALVCFAATVVPAQLLPEAAAAFPAQTTSLEYDALSKLRLLPNYASLRKQYSGAGLQQAQKDLQALGISEDQLSEVVTASGPNGFFGLLAGGFHAAAATKEAAKHGIAPNGLEDGPVFCSKDGTCFLFISQEDGHAFFGTMEQLRAISDVRQGRAPSLQTNATFMDLKSRMDQQSPVLGFAPGREISDWIGPSIPPAISSRLDLSRLFSNIQTFGYSVKLDSKAHVGLSLICSSEQAGVVLRDALSAASGLERAAAMAAGSSALPFDNMAVQSSGRLVAVNLDAPIQ